MAKFQKGQSGNPAGRRPGTQTRITRLRALFEPHAEELVLKAVEMAKNGDGAAMRLCLERLIPAFKPEARLEFGLPLSEATPLASIGRAAVRALAEGNTTPDGVQALMAGLAGLAKLIETDELERRVAALEHQRQNAG